MVNSKTGASRENGELSDNDKSVLDGKGGRGINREGESRDHKKVSTMAII